MTMTRVCVLAVVLAAAPAAQQVSTDHEWCRDENWGRDRTGVCEVRRFTMAGSGGVLSADASPNGGIAVEGSARGDILVLAKVVATADTEARAREISSGVQVSATGNEVRATGPGGLSDRDEGWHVSYWLYVPTQTSLDLRTVNGGIKITGVEGRIEFRTINGGVKLSNLAGDVRGGTNNGGVDIELEGAAWRGEGLDVKTQNGGVRVGIPEHYSARLETGTVNGRLRVDFPVTVQGRIDRDIETTLGGGGALIRIRTTNGGVKISRK